MLAGRRNRSNFGAMQQIYYLTCFLYYYSTFPEGEWGKIKQYFVSKFYATEKDTTSTIKC